MPAPDTARRPSPRGRRASRPSGHDRERAILDTASALLREHGPDGFSVDDLARGAGLSRPTFYFYFASKEAVILTLLDRVVEESERATPQVDFVDDAVGSWRAVIQSIVDVFAAHREVVAAAVQARTVNPELRSLWSAAMQRWIERTAASIESERRHGAAPAGRPALEIATALNLMNERVLAATFTNESPGLPQDEVADVLLAVWLPAIYGTVDL